MEEKNKLTKKGGWIIVRKSIPTDIPITPLSVFYATAEKREIRNNWIVNQICPTNIGFIPEAELETIQMAVIKNEYGEIKLNPDEYSILSEDAVSAIMDSIGNGYELVYLSESEDGSVKFTSKKVKDAVFYCNSRGISRVEALKMCLGMISSKNLFYIEPQRSTLSMFLYEEDIEFGEKKKREYKEKLQKTDE